MEQTIHIKEATEFSEEIFSAVTHLVPQLDSNFHPLTEKDMREILSDKQTRLLLAWENEKIIGMLTLITYRIPYKKKGWVEDVVVDNPHRGKGVGKLLLKEAIELARKEGLHSLNLTSRPNREEANTLYHKLGFEKRDTNVYQIKL